MRKSSEKFQANVTKRGLVADMVCIVFGDDGNPLFFLLCLPPNPDLL